jgi:hypothetical protein
VVDEIGERSATVAGRVLDLDADVVERLALPAHLEGCKVPLRVAGHACGIEIDLEMTDRATETDGAEAVRPALDGRLVQTAMLALARAVPDGVAIQAAGMGEDLSELGEVGLRALALVGNGGKACR